MLVLLLVAGAAFVGMQGTPAADWVTRAVAARVVEWQAVLSGTTAVPPRRAATAETLPSQPAPMTAATVPAPLVETAASPTPEPLAATPVEPIVAPPPMLAAAPMPSAPPPPAPPAPAPRLRSLSLRADAAVWVEVRHEHGGRVVLNRTMQPGEIWTVPADPDLMLSTGNAPGLELIVDGQPQPLPRGKGGVLRDVPLHPDAEQG